jgi:hypothetical protein
LAAVAGIVIPKFLLGVGVSFYSSLIGRLNKNQHWLEREYIERPNVLLIALTGCDLDQYYKGCVRLFQ